MGYFMIAWMHHSNDILGEKQIYINPKWLSIQVPAGKTSFNLHNRQAEIRSGSGMNEHRQSGNLTLEPCVPETHKDNLTESLGL